MPMVPGLSADMPSRVSLEDDTFSSSWPDNFTFEPLFDDFNFNFGNADLINLPDHMSDDGMYNSDSFSQDVLKRECLFGKPIDQCLRECGQQCEAFIEDPDRLGYNTNMPRPCHTAEDFLRMVNPQAVLPQQLPYNPYEDHSYYQTIGFPDSETKDTDDLGESDSPSDDSADEIVDVETVQDKAEPPVNKVVKKRGRKPVKKLKFSNSKPVALNNKRTTVMKRSGKMMQSSRVAKGRRRGKSSCEPSSASSSDAEEHGKRSNHNNMERHRRDEQKRMLQGLRVLIPSIKGNPKTPKVMILTEAAKFIFHLRNQGSLLEQTILNEKEKHRRYLRRKRELSEDSSRS